MENRIKEQQLGLFADRTCCHGWWANQFRVLLSAAAYVLLETIRRIGLRGTELAPGAGGHDPAQALEDRHGDRAQHPPHPAPVFERLSLRRPAAPVLARLSSA